MARRQLGFLVAVAITLCGCEEQQGPALGTGPLPEYEGDIWCEPDGAGLCYRDRRSCMRLRWPRNLPECERTGAWALTVESLGIGGAVVTHQLYREQEACVRMWNHGARDGNGNVLQARYSGCYEVEPSPPPEDEASP